MPSKKPSNGQSKQELGIDKNNWIMGYKKLDEVMELMTDELDGFKKTVDRLENLTQNVGNIKIEADTSEIIKILKDHVRQEEKRSETTLRLLKNLKNSISKSRMVPKVQMWLFCFGWLISISIIGYLVLKLI